MTGLSALALLLISSLAAAFAEQAREAEAPRLELSFSRASGRAGEEVALPIFVTSNANVKEPFKIVLKYPAAQLRYKELETGLLARKAGWTLRARLEPTPNERDLSLLEIDVVPGDAKFFPSGAIAYAHFVILEGASDGELLLEASLEIGGATEIAVETEPAKITVYSKLIYSCFFYMH